MDITTSPRHRMLERQLARLGMDGGVPTQQQWTEFLGRVDASYRESEQASRMLERSLEMSSREMLDRQNHLQTRTDARVTLERNRLELIFSSVLTAMMVVDRTGSVTSINPEAARLLGPATGLMGRHVSEVLQLVGRDGEPRPLIERNDFEHAMQADPWVRTDIRLVSEVRGVIAVHVSLMAFRVGGRQHGGLVVLTDNSEREEARSRQAWLATHDGLTRLPNRSMLTERIEIALVQARRTGHWPSLLFLDLDRFKSINDSMGHAAGDRLLVAAAERLQRCVRSIDTVARLGGDEFVVLCESAEDHRVVRALADRLLVALTEQFDLDGELAYVSTSIGIAHGSETYANADGLLHDADLAMYRAKELGRNRVEVVDDRLREQSKERVLLERGLRVALANDGIYSAYQPVHRTDTGELVGFEALARWNDELLGNVPPDRFIAIAEDTGLINALGEQMFDMACRDVAEWNRERALHGIGPPLVVHINLSSRELVSPTLIERVTGALTRYGVPAAQLMVEMTESVLMDDAEFAVHRLEELREIGVSIAIDDFGTGYSSFAYLRRFPVNMIKIDREFIRTIATSRQDQRIVRAITDLAHGLNYRVLAEGVEKQSQLDVLRRLGCEFVQGYLLGIPMPNAGALDLALANVPIALPA